MAQQPNWRDRMVIDGEQATITIDPHNAADYPLFLAAKRLPNYRVNGNRITTNRDYLRYLDPAFGTEAGREATVSSHLWDYQAFIVKVALRKRRYAVFAEAGLGKTAIFLEWARHVRDRIGGRKILIVSPLAVISQTMDEERKFYGANLITDIHHTGLDAWLDSDSPIGITNFEKFIEPHNLRGRVGAVIIDESSVLKNADGKTRTSLIETFKGLEYKLACTATPAPNDREEYASHALFLEQIRSTNEFFARYFIQKDNQWMLKAHAAEAFYRYLSGFSVFLRDPKRYGFADNLAGLLPPIIQEVHVPLTPEQVQAAQDYQTGDGRQLTITGDPASLQERTKSAQIAKGFVLVDGKPVRIPSEKPKTVAELLAKHPGEQAIIWTAYDEEGEILAEAIPGAVHLYGKTPERERECIVEDFRMGHILRLITKPRLMGFGMNFQFCTVQVWSGFTDSFEQLHQGIKRSHRYGQTKQLHVYMVVTHLEEPLLRNVLSKKTTFEADASYQEDLYIESLAEDLREFMERSEAGTVKEKEPRTPVNPDQVRRWFERGKGIAS